MTTPTTPPPPASFEDAKGHRWLTVQEAAVRLGVTTGRVYHLTSSRRVVCGLHQGLTYIREDSVQAYRRYRMQLAALRKTGRALDQVAVR